MERKWDKTGSKLYKLKLKILQDNKILELSIKSLDSLKYAYSAPMEIGNTSP